MDNARRNQPRPIHQGVAIVICKQCGKVSYDRKGAHLLAAAQYDEMGKLVYAICQHGNTPLDKRATEYDMSLAKIPLAMLAMEARA